MELEAIPLNNHVGAEVITNIETLLDPQVAAATRELLVARGVLLFRNLALTETQQVMLAGMMGGLRSEGEKGIYKITLDKKENAKADYLKGSFLWHIDGTQDDIPPFASLLTAVKLSDVGGQTGFASAYAAYDALPKEMKDRIADLRVVHSVELSMRRAGVDATPENVKHWRTIPDKTHNLVWRHKTGRKSLVIGCHASHIEGMDKSEGEHLLAELLTWTTKPEFVYWHQWTPGDLLIWDNTGVLHRVEPYPLDSGRMMHRTTLLGEESFA